MRKEVLALMAVGALAFVACTPGKVYLERGDVLRAAGNREAAEAEYEKGWQAFQESSSNVKEMTPESHKQRLWEVYYYMNPKPTPAPTMEPTPMPTDAERYGKPFVDAGCKQALPMAVLLTTNPYAVKGNCYFIRMHTLQILGRHTGLYELHGSDFEIVCYLDFGKKDASPQSFVGIAKGIGAYEYVTTGRASKVIPKLKVVMSPPTE